MNLDEEIVGKIELLIDEGNSVFNSPGVWPKTSDRTLFYQWRMSCLSVLRSISRDKLGHYIKIFESDVKMENHEDIQAGIGILNGLKDDVKNGFLEAIEDLVVADIFTDFLEMAEHLLEKKYKDPAASLIGAVLEDGLKKIAVKNGIRIVAKDEISSLSQKLSDAEIFNKLKYSQIQSQTKIRNHADHGEFGEYTHKDVGAFLNWTRDFLEEYLK